MAPAMNARRLDIFRIVERLMIRFVSKGVEEKLTVCRATTGVDEGFEI